MNQMKKERVSNIESTKQLCVFCAIANRENDQSGRIIGEDIDFVAMLVSHPQTKGHFIVFPKVHFPDLNCMSKSFLAKLFKTTVDWAEIFCNELGTNSYVLKLNNNVYLLDPDPLHVGHIHLHVIPRYSLQDDLSSRPVEEDKEYFESVLSLLTK